MNPQASVEDRSFSLLAGDEKKNFDQGEPSEESLERSGVCSFWVALKNMSGVLYVLLIYLFVQCLIPFFLW